MKFFSKAKDGGPESKVWGYWLIELKWLFSIVLLRFEDGTRDAYHSHAFNSISWLLSGKLIEHFDLKSPERIESGKRFVVHTPKFRRKIYTMRTTTHKVFSVGRSWVLSFRGPWSKTWKEVLPDGTETVLQHGRVVSE